MTSAVLSKEIASFVYNRAFVKSVYQKLYFLISPQCDGSFEHPKNMLKLMDKKYLQFYAKKVCLISKPVFVF